MRKAILVVVTAVAAAVLGAPPAHADQYDFVYELDANGVYYNDMFDVIELGKSVCRTIRVGQNSYAVGQVNTGLISAGYYAPAERSIIVIAAANTMCPDIWPVLRALAQESQMPTAAV